VLTDYYVCEVSSFEEHSEDVFEESGLRAWLRALVSARAALISLVNSSSQLDPYREKSRRDAAMWVIAHFSAMPAFKAICF
jgi:hypothetical protein